MIKRIYEDPSTDRLMEVSAARANDYYSDLIIGHGQKAPEDAVDGFVKPGLVRDARIMNSGFGTGMVGLLLREVGFAHMDGSDLSTEIHTIAASHYVYERLFQLDMTKDYGIAPADAFNAVISVGVFGFGPPHLTHLHQIMGAAKKEAPMMITVNGFAWTIHNWDDSFALHLNKHGIACVRNEPIQLVTRDGIGARLIELQHREVGP